VSRPQEERDSFGAELLEGAGLVDAFRAQHPAVVRWECVRGPQLLAWQCVRIDGARCLVVVAGRCSSGC
jgi:hypothetical protein